MNRHPSASPEMVSARHASLPHAVPAAAFFAGSVMLLALGLLSITVYQEPAFKLVAMMAATVIGPEALQRGADLDASVLAAAFAVHFGLALVYAAALATILRDLPEWSAPWAGMAFGALVYCANLHGFTLAFGWFAELRTVDTFVAHVAFGLLLARGVSAPRRPHAAAQRLALT